MELLKLVLLATGIIGLAVIGLAINILLRKSGKFPNTHVSGNKYLKGKGVSCIQAYDRTEQKKAREKPDFKNLTLIRKQ